MNCPNCGADNEAGSRFCISCGSGLVGGISFETEVGGGGWPARSGNPFRRQIGYATARVVVGVLLAFFIRSILLGLSFVDELIIPDFPLRVFQLVDMLTYVVVIILLVAFMQMIRANWLQAFPRARELSPAIVSVLLVLALSWLYRALLPLVVQILDNPADFLLVLRITLFLLALFLLGRAGLLVYGAVPVWLDGLSLDLGERSETS